MTQSKISGADYLLLLFYVKGSTGIIGEPIEGRTRITKMMFIFKKEIFGKLKLNKFSSEEDLPKFEAYHYGPFSYDVHEQLDLFTNIGFIEDKTKVIRKNDELDYDSDLKSIDENESLLEEQLPTVSEYRLTPLGIKYVENEIIPNLENKEQVILFLEQFKKQINTTDLRSILSYVYNKYPEYASKSKIREKVK
jgi:uncharacterized protein